VKDTMKLWLWVVALCAVLVPVPVRSSKLVHDQVQVYRRILEEGFGRKEVDVEGIVQLMHLMDGNPKYNRAGLQYIANKLGANSMSYIAFEDLINKIYGDQISDDPYQPQEIHIALGNELSTMKVQWVTMSELEKPVVEYQEDAKCADWTNAKSASASSYTYSVPQKWWPVFTGMIYEANMINLTPRTKYCYRVGGYDSVNATMRYSEVFQFSAPPLPNNPSHTTRIATLADHGTFMLMGWETIDRMVAMQDSLKFDYVFVAGDLSYAGLSSAMPKLNISKEDEVSHSNYVS
jgi:hypothetical protein